MSSRQNAAVGFSIAFTCLLGIAAGASAQEMGAIAGTVKDATGAVLPGVTVEAASPALIEKVRTVVSDGAGQYKIVALPPGVYTVTFSLTGFTSLKREGVQLSTGFTANVNGELRVGTVEETVLVTGEAPLVDVQNVRRQAVMTREIVEALPTGKTFQEMATLIPGVQLMNGSAAGTGTGGALGTESFSSLAAHGGRTGDMRIEVNGQSTNVFNAGVARTWVNFQDGNIDEYVFEYAANSVETETGGVRVNLVPKDGGNQFHGYFYADYSRPSFQADNMTAALRATGVSDPDKVKELWQANPSFGGPILKDKLWFYGAYSHKVATRYKAGIYFNTNPSSWVPTPDKTRQAFSGDVTNDTNGRITYQATSKQKLSFYYDDNRLCQCPYLVGSTSFGIFLPDGATLEPRPGKIVQIAWTAPVTNKILLQVSGGTTRQLDTWDFYVPPGGPSVLEQSNGWSWGSPHMAQMETSVYNDPQVKATVSYVTGSHALKFGVSGEWQTVTHTFDQFQNLSITLNNAKPVSLTYYDTPLPTANDSKKFAAYLQDQWTIKHLTLNMGARFDHYWQGFPDHHLAPVQYAPIERDFAAATIVNWNDVSPRLGVAYDLFGNGKTAIKGSISRYLQVPAELTNPARSNSTMVRTWTDPNGDSIIQGDPLNPAMNLELGPSQNLNFGLPVNPNHYDASALGWFSRPSDWEGSVSAQHEIAPGVSVNAAYFRRWYSNFTVTDNLLVGPGDYSPYCVPVPSDSRLSNAGQQLCGLFDLNPTKRGLSNNLITNTNVFGSQYEHWNGVDFSVQARLAHSATLQGGVSTGRTTTDNCDVVSKVDNPSTLYCHNDTPFLTQVKLGGSYTLPWDVSVAATVQTFSGASLLANATFTNAQVFPTLERNLTNGVTTIVNVLTPNSQFLPRVTQLDMRFSKSLQAGHFRIKGMVDLYNLMNINTILSANNTYGTNGSAWQVPLSISLGRLMKLGAQVTF